MKLSRRLLLAATLLGLGLSAPAASAEDAVAKRLMQKRKSERYEVATPHSSIKAGAARISVKAPTKVVKKTITDFKNYSKLSKKFEKSKVVGRDGDKRHVYLQVPIMKGVAKIWAVVAFEPIKKVGDTEVLEAHMVKGNVKRLDAKWIVKKIDDENTQVDLIMLIVPEFPAPGSLVTGEVAYASDLAVTGARDRSEKKHAKKK